MKREASGTAALFMAMYLVFQNGQGRPVASQSGTRNTNHSAAVVEAKKENAENKKDEAKAFQLMGPWLATRSFFGLPSPDNKQYANGLLSLDEKGPVQNPDAIRELLGMDGTRTIRAVVATVADPAHTRLQLFFDQQIQALQRAAAAQDWEFAGQWLPPTFNYEHAAGDLKSRLEARLLLEQQEAQPGILIFRRPPVVDSFPKETLFIFLVPEAPTSGVSAMPFHVAMKLAAAASRKDSKIGLLAPSFSGSFESLSRLVMPWKSVLHEQVFGGSVSSTKYAEAFRNDTDLDFSSGIASSDQFEKALLDTLKDYGTSCNAVAILTEDETAFGHTAGTNAASTQGVGYCDPTQFPVFRFPRDIAHLRNTYQETLASTGNKNTQSAPSIDFTLKDPSHGEDGVPVFSSTHTPIEQSAVLTSITSEFRRRGTRLVYIVSTNILDTVFLARLIHSESPNTRILVGDPDLLFLPAGVRDSLVGTLFLSTYPMFLQGEEWLSRNPSLFSSETAQGLFNVTQLLLLEMGHGAKDNEPQLASYRPLNLLRDARNKPLDPYQRPGVWLLMLTRSGLAPIDWFPFEGTLTWMQSVAGTTEPSPIIDSTAKPSMSWRSAAYTMLLLGILTMSLLAVAYKLNIQSPNTLWQLNLRTMQRGQFLALTGGALSVSALDWVLGLPALYVPQWQWLAILLVWMAGASLCFAIYCGKIAYISTKYHAANVCQDNDKLSLGNLLLYMVPTAFFYQYLVFAWWLACYHPWKPIRASLFRIRSLDLFTNASASLPFVGLCTVYIIFFLWLLWRYSRHYNPHPVIWFPKGSGTRFREMTEGYYYAEAFLSAPLLHVNLKSHVWRFVAALLPACLFAGVLWGSLSAFEIRAYNFALGWAVAILVLLLAVTCYDLCLFWIGLKRFLSGLETPAMQDAVDRVTKHWHKRSVLTLGAGSPQRDARLQMEERLDDIPISDPDCSFEIRVSSRMLECLNRPDYARDEDFCALQFCRFLIHAVGQAQRMTWVVSLCFVMLALTLNSYSPRGPVLIGQVIVVCFVIVSSIVVWVLSGMERDVTLSRMTRSDAGALGWEFWLRLGGLGVLPFVSVLAGLFPGISGFLSSFVAPNLDSVLR